MYLAKCALAADGQALLRVELPVRQFDLLHFEDALEAMTRYRRDGDSFEPALVDQAARQIIEMIDRHPLERSLLSARQIQAFFIQLAKEGWRVVEEPEGDSWSAVHEGAYRRYSVYVTFTGGWIYFQAPLITYIPDKANAESLSMLLLELNERIYWAKFATHTAATQQGDVVEGVVLAVEAPANGCTFAVFQEAAHTLATYLERYFFEIKLLSVESELSPLILGRAPDPAWFSPPRRHITF